jgi:Zn finger protein HypA/HybF involved in hydrogenase expression
MAETAYFKCLRCEHTYEADYTPKVVEERTCPKCGSNSVRRLKTRPAEKELN